MFKLWVKDLSMLTSGNLCCPVAITIDITCRPDSVGTSLWSIRDSHTARQSFRAWSTTCRIPMAQVLGVFTLKKLTKLKSDSNKRPYHSPEYQLKISLASRAMKFTIIFLFCISRLNSNI